MASSAANPTLPHRTVSSIRAGSTAAATQGGGGSSSISGSSAPAPPHTPHTPSQSRHSIIPSIAFGSPSSLRAADDDLVVVELGARRVRVGFAGDPAPKKVAALGPEQQRRVGDFRTWTTPAVAERGRTASAAAAATARTGWGSDHELWRLDVRGEDLALVGDRLERELRDALTKHLLLDSKPRRMALVLPPTIPIPLLSSVLNTIFHRFQTPSISLLSSPVMTAMAAGTRSALVVDLGWHETTVTGVYEYREVHSWRTIRAGKMLINETYNFLADAVEGVEAREKPREDTNRDVISFEECEEVATRLLWCKRKSKRSPQQDTEGLPTLHEQDESETVDPAEDTSPFSIPLISCDPPRTLQIPFSQLAEPCEATFFEKRLAPSCFDDHELPVHLLVYRALLQLPMDVRAICMSRIIFTGGCSNVIGLKGRIFDEVSLLAQERGWDAVVGKGVEQYKTNPKLKRNKSRQAAGAAVGEDPTPAEGISPTTTTGFPSHPEGGGGWGDENAASSSPISPTTPNPNPNPNPNLNNNPAYAEPEEDQVERLIRKERSGGRQPPAPPPVVRGTLRVVDSLGPWCGASLAAQLKVPALAVVDRELWLLHGAAGASKPGDIDAKAQQQHHHHQHQHQLHQHQRHSVGPGGLIRGQGSQVTSWTLGVWGAL